MASLESLKSAVTASLEARGVLSRIKVSIVCVVVFGLVLVFFCFGSWLTCTHTYTHIYI